MMMDNQSLLLIQPLLSNDVLNAGVSSRLVYEGSPCAAFPCWNGGTCSEQNNARRERRRQERQSGKRKRVVVHLRGNQRNNEATEKQEAAVEREEREDGEGGGGEWHANDGYSCKCRPFFRGKHCEQTILMPSMEETIVAGRKEGGEGEGSGNQFDHWKNCSSSSTAASNCPEGTICVVPTDAIAPPIPSDAVVADNNVAKCIPVEKAVVHNNIELLKNGGSTRSTECLLACQNAGICLRLGTAPGHFECVCQSNYTGPLCQFPLPVTGVASLSLLPGLILLSVLLFMLVLLLLLCQFPASTGFFFLELSKTRKGNQQRQRSSRKWPLLLQQWAVDGEEEGEEIVGRGGDEWGEEGEEDEWAEEDQPEAAFLGGGTSSGIGRTMTMELRQIRNGKNTRRTGMFGHGHHYHQFRPPPPSSPFPTTINGNNASVPFVSNPMLVHHHQPSRSTATLMIQATGSTTAAGRLGKVVHI